jgi:hypothetical protein
VGQVFVVDLMLQTGANGQILDGEYLAHADFFNSGGFQLSLGDIPGLTLTQIRRVDNAPEPGISTLVAAGLGLIEWFRRRCQASA